MDRDSQDPEFLFCNGGFTPPLLLLLLLLLQDSIRVVLSPLEDDRLVSVIQYKTKLPQMYLTERKIAVSQFITSDMYIICYNTCNVAVKEMNTNQLLSIKQSVFDYTFIFFSSKTELTADSLL